ncbi:MAG TPA: 3-oxoacyl-ACP reductase [Rhodospirillaceae bacterium]|nr:3-oxoacyl-ACP reductase [Rhodospirillaceae bacterium]|tara:strand:- start:174 stop:974 length:801 start_codon:yes stop_codon:yes gene_type:complete
MKRLQGKVAIVTGSTGGVGLGVARRYAAEGATVMVTGRSEDKGRMVVDAITKEGGKAEFVAADVQSKADMDALAAQTVRAHGKIDVLVASASGVPSQDTNDPSVRGIFNEIEVGAVTEVVGRATAAKLLPLHAVLPYMIEAESGSCMFVTSEGGRVPTAGQTTVALYAGGLVMATKVIAKEMARHKVRINCIAVTLIGESPSWDAFEGKIEMTDLHRAQYARIQQRAPLGIANPDDIAGVATFLASEDSAYLTGSTLSPTGGLTFH